LKCADLCRDDPPVRQHQVCKYFPKLTLQRTIRPYRGFRFSGEKPNHVKRRGTNVQESLYE
jgi:hypothetical protein